MDALVAPEVKSAGVAQDRRVGLEQRLSIQEVQFWGAALCPSQTDGVLAPCSHCERNPSVPPVRSQGLRRRVASREGATASSPLGFPVLRPQRLGT